MNGSRQTGTVRLAPNKCPSGLAAYRDGLGLAAVTVIDGPAGVHIAASTPNNANSAGAAVGVMARWWCRGTAEAERVAAAAAARINRRKPSDDNSSIIATRIAGAETAHSDSSALACASVIAAAKRLNVVLFSDDALREEVASVAARVDAELQALQQSGGLKSVNKAYRSYRLEARARGERILRYDEWMRDYRNNLIAQVAATLRLI